MEGEYKINHKGPVAIIGGGTIGRALASHYAAEYSCEVQMFTRRGGEGKAHHWHNRIALDIGDEGSIAAAAERAEGGFERIIVATGLLHDDHLQPEKSLKQLSAENLQRYFQINSVGPALVAKYFLPLLKKANRDQQPSVFAALSARVGSIGDNRLGGWYGYRASKAALNMLLRCAAIEIERQQGRRIVVGLHPGTVDSALSKPFQQRVPAEKLFSPSQAATYLVKVIEGLGMDDNGKCFAWDGQPIAP